MMMMKKLIPTFLVAAVLAAVAVSPAEAQQQGQQKVTLQQVYDQAVADFNAQKYEEAKKGFERVLKAKPGLPRARKYVAQIEAEMKNPQKKKQTMEAPLAKLTVSKFTFKDASFGTVLEYLTKKSTELSGGEVTANFIYKGPAEDFDKKLITLSLANVPLTEVIRYVGAQVGVRFAYEEFAVVGTPLAAAQKVDAAEAATAKEEASLKEPARKSFLEEREEKESKAAQNPFK